MASVDLNALLGQIGRDKGISREVLIDAIESAMLSAARRHFGHQLNLEARFNEETGEVEVFQFKLVVESPAEVQDPDTQVPVDEARRDYDPDATVGEEVGRNLNTDALGRIAAQTAKQVIIQKVRDAERAVIFEEFKGSKGELINGIVQRYDRGGLIVNLGRTEAIVPKREQIGRERYRQGDRIRSMILDIDQSARGPQIILTRSHPDLLKKLFEIEVPEIAEHVIEIRAVAREPGERAKIAVHSTDSNIDPVGACVGIKGSRVQAVVQELRGERIDIITWTADEPSFVARALAPAEITRVLVDEDEHSMEVIVADDQLSLAIGRRGQNVKLASRLTGWKIDVRSVTIAEEEAKRARQSIEAIPGLDFTHAELLFQQGYRSAAEIAEANIDDLLEISGFTEELANELIASAKKYAEQLETEGKLEPSAEDGTSDLDRLNLDPEIKKSLMRAGFKSIQRLVEVRPDELIGLDGLGEIQVAAIKDAVDAFFKSGYSNYRASLNR